MNMHCYFLLNVKHGASQLYFFFGGGLQLSSAGTERDLPLTIDRLYMCVPNKARAEILFR